MPRAKKTQVQTPSETPPARERKARQTPEHLPSKPGLGHMLYSDREMAPQFAQPIDKKQTLGRNTWADTALVLALRAKKASQTYGKKDFNALYRLVLSAGIAYDKAWPQQQATLSGNLVVQLFGSLGQATARTILEPSYPVLDITPQVDPPSTEPTGTSTMVEPPSAKPLDDTN